MSYSRKGTCGRGPEGSGYVKPTDSAKAAEIERAYQDALTARSMYNNFWTQSYDPDGSNAQPGWPSTTPINPDVTDFKRMMTIRAEEDKKWQDAFVDLSEFTGVSDTRTVTVDYPLEIFDVSGGICGEVKIKEEPVAFDEYEFDMIELVD